MIISCAIAACGEAEPDAAEQASPASAKPAIEITDVLGRTVRLDQPAKRIAALSPGFVETLFAVGCGDKVVLRDLWSDYPEAAKALPAADGVKPSVRHVAGYDPDLVLLYSNDVSPAVPFEKVGLTVAVFDPRSFAEVITDVEKLGALCGASDPAQELATRMTRLRDRVAEQARRSNHTPLVYAEIDGSDIVRPWTAGPGSFVHELLGISGARNVAAEVSSAYAQVSAESVIRADPEVVLLLDAGHPGNAGSAERIAARPGWSELRAVREGRVVDFIDPDVLSRPGPRLADGLRALFDALHPESR